MSKAVQSFRVITPPLKLSAILFIKLLSAIARYLLYDELVKRLDLQTVEVQFMAHHLLWNRTSDVPNDAAGIWGPEAAQGLLAQRG